MGMSHLGPSIELLEMHFKTPQILLKKRAKAQESTALLKAGRCWCSVTPDSVFFAGENFCRAPVLAEVRVQLDLGLRQHFYIKYGS